MTIEQLNKAIKITERIDFCKKNLSLVKPTQFETCGERELFLTFYGIEETITIPDSLFRTIGELIQTKYSLEVMKLEKQLKEL